VRKRPFYGYVFVISSVILVNSISRVMSEITRIYGYCYAASSVNSRATALSRFLSGGGVTHTGISFDTRSEPF